MQTPERSAAQTCDQPMRGLYGATTICARPAGHTGKHDPIWNHEDWPNTSAACIGGKAHEWRKGHCVRCGAYQPRHDESPAATVDLEAIVNQQADRNAWLEGDIAGWRIKLAAAEWAFADALLALEELGHSDVADRLRERWPEVKAKS